MLQNTMRFFDAHCDTIGKILEAGVDFADSGGDTLHVTLPGLRAAGVRAQVFASWAWTGKYPGREFEVGMSKVEAVQRLCAEHPDDLFLALTGADVAAACEAAAPNARIAVIPSLEGADALLGEVDNLAVFHRAGVRLITLAWHDSVFCGSTYGAGAGLTPKGLDLVEACEDARVMVDVSHASDRSFADICRVAKRQFVASHSNCRSLCPSPRNLTDGMIRSVAERGGVVGITLAPDFLSEEHFRATRPSNEAFWRAVAEGVPVDEAGRRSAEAESAIPRPPLALVADHVRHAIDVGGEDAVGLGGDLDGVDALPAGLDGVHDYPRIAELLAASGLTPVQVEKVCWGNMARVFEEVLG